jgi:hypothetical protein
MYTALRSKCTWRDLNANEDALELLKAGATMGQVFKYKANWIQNVSTLGQTCKIFPSLNRQRPSKRFSGGWGLNG